MRDLFFCKQLALVVNKQGQSTIKTVLLHFVTKSEPNFGHSILKQPQDQKNVYGPAMPSVQCPPFSLLSTAGLAIPLISARLSSGGWFVVGGLMI